MDGAQQRVVIVGAGQAGSRTALALRQEGWQGAIVLIGAENEHPYERPPLSKDVLQGRALPGDATILSAEQCQDQGIELRLGEEVRRIDPRARRLHLHAGRAPLHYDHLVLATGSRPRCLPLPGAGLDGVHVLRTAADALAIAARLEGGMRVVLVGGGFIGLEAAASARLRGCRVTVLETAPQLMARVVAAPIAERMMALHRGRGVEIRTGVRIDGLEGLREVRRVRLADGSAVDADIVILGVGALANDGLPVSAGIRCADGVIVDRYGRTSAPFVYAAGDLARHEQLWGCGNVRLESWENAELQAREVAGALLDRPAPERGAPWFWTDQFDTNLQIIGFGRARGELVMRGSCDDRSWCAFLVSDGRIQSAVLHNAGRERRVVAQLIERRISVSARDLGDIGRPLRTLAAAA